MIVISEGIVSSHGEAVDRFRWPVTEEYFKVMSSSVNIASFLKPFASDNIICLDKHFYSSLQFLFHAYQSLLETPFRNLVKNSLKNVDR